MKNLLAVLLIVTTVCESHGYIKFDSRADWHHQNSYTDAANVHKKEFSQFEITRARLAMSGQLNDDVTGYLRVDIIKESTVGKDGSTPILNYAFVTHKLSHLFAVSGGKLWLYVGGIESIYSGADIYFGTLASEGQRPNLTGVAVDITPDAYNWITVFSANNEDTTGASQQRQGYGLTYQGYFMDKHLNVIASYVSTYRGIQGTEKPRFLSAAGLQYKTPTNLAIDFGYVNNFDKETSPTSDTNTTSFLAQLKYTFGHWSPLLKIESTQFETGSDATSFERKRMGAAIEMRPYPDKNFRYHVAWDSLADQYRDDSIANPTVTQSQVYVGMRLVADLL